MSTVDDRPPTDAEVQHAFDVLRRHYEATRAERRARASTPSRPPAQRTRRPSSKASNDSTPGPTDAELLAAAGLVPAAGRRTA